MLYVVLHQKVPRRIHIICYSKQMFPTTSNIFCWFLCFVSWFDCCCVRNSFIYTCVLFVSTTHIFNSHTTHFCFLLLLLLLFLSSSQWKRSSVYIHDIRTLFIPRIKTHSLSSNICFCSLIAEDSFFLWVKATVARHNPFITLDVVQGNPKNRRSIHWLVYSWDDAPVQRRYAKNYRNVCFNSINFRVCGGIAASDERIFGYASVLAHWCSCWLIEWSNNNCELFLLQRTYNDAGWWPASWSRILIVIECNINKRYRYDERLHYFENNYTLISYCCWIRVKVSLWRHLCGPIINI